jgi:hypothetical protein
MTWRDPLPRSEAGGRRGFESEGPQDAADEGVVEGTAIKDLDEATEDAVTAVAIGPARSRFMKESHSGKDLGHVALKTVVAVPGVREIVSTIEAARVGEEVANRHSLGCTGNGDAEVRQIGRDRIVEGNLHLLDVLEYEERRHRFGNRADLEQLPRLDPNADLFLLGTGDPDDRVDSGCPEATYGFGEHFAQCLHGCEFTPTVVRRGLMIRLPHFVGSLSSLKPPDVVWTFKARDTTVHSLKGTVV